MPQNQTKYNFDTNCVKHPKMRGNISPITTPIVASSTFQIKSVVNAAALSAGSRSYENHGWLYSRMGNPTVDVAARAITQLEIGGIGSLITSSGMSAITTTIMSFIKSGDHIVCGNSLYIGTHMFFTLFLPKLNVEVTQVDASDADAFGTAIKKNTILIYAETPTNPSLKILDLKKLVQQCKSNSNANPLIMIDNTFASPFNQNPITFGVDIVAHSCTKYLGGHSDVTLGSITFKENTLLFKVWFSTIMLGPTPSPQDVFLLLRGIKTLSIRMRRINKTALKVAKFLETHPRVGIVNYPGLSSHPHHTLAAKQKTKRGGYGGVMSFSVLGGSKASNKLLESLEVIKFAVSLGGVESLAENASEMTHNKTIMTTEQQKAAGVTEGLIRLSVGLEDVDDIIHDLESALKISRPKSTL